MAFLYSSTGSSLDIDGAIAAMARHTDAKELGTEWLNALRLKTRSRFEFHEPTHKTKMALVDFLVGEANAALAAKREKDNERAYILPGRIEPIEDEL